MTSQILRPTGPGGNRWEKPWLIRGTWGEREIKPMAKSDLRDLLWKELLQDGILPPDAPRPSNKYHSHLTDALYHASWIEGRWVKDEPLADRLRRIRGDLSQEKFAGACKTPVSTIKALESGARGSNATWATLAAIAAAMKRSVVIFCGITDVEGFPPEKEAVTV